ncbi:MAG: UV DNA damage repair endonuclease UvsE [Chitinivibrionales bacterium]|nr:UV DNA damage repair endonuclease UvsE [Chitinivibrionales bacterium]
MRIGYPCINRGMDCTPNRTFRLASYSEERLYETVGMNLGCLGRVLAYNVENGLFAFRIGSQLVPFASHPVCTADWRTHFAAQLRDIGAFAQRHHMRLSMHPDQFVVLNSLSDDVVRRSVAELAYHAAVLDAMQLPSDAKIQLHLGGVYGDKQAAMERFAAAYHRLPPAVRRRLVIENDDCSYSLRDCLHVHEQIGIPVVLDTFHHECLNSGEPLAEAAAAAHRTWGPDDGPLMVDYSSQKEGARVGSHTESLSARHFRNTMDQLTGVECDVMLEIKDKEQSALRALAIVRKQG